MKKVLRIILIVFMWLISAMFAVSTGVLSLELLSALDDFIISVQNIFSLFYIGGLAATILVSFIIMIISIVKAAKKEVDKPMPFVNGIFAMFIFVRFLFLFVLHFQLQLIEINFATYGFFVLMFFVTISGIRRKKGLLESNVEEICHNIAHILFFLLAIYLTDHTINNSGNGSFIQFDNVFSCFAILVLLYQIVKLLYEFYGNKKIVEGIDIASCEVISTKNEFVKVRHYKTKSNCNVADIIFRIITICALCYFALFTIINFVNEPELISYEAFSYIGNLIQYFSYLPMVFLIGSVIYSIINIAGKKAKGYSTLVDINSSFLYVLMILVLGAFIYSIGMILHNNEYNVLTITDLIYCILHLFTFIALIILATSFSFKAKNIKAMAENNMYNKAKSDIIGHSISTNVLVVVFSIYYVYTTKNYLNVINFILVCSFAFSILTLINVGIKSPEFETVYIKVSDYNALLNPSEDIQDEIIIEDTSVEQEVVEETPVEQVETPVEETPVSEEVNPTEEVATSIEQELAEESPVEQVEAPVEETPVSEEFNPTEQVEAPAEEAPVSEEVNPTEKDSKTDDSQNQ